MIVIPAIDLRAGRCVRLLRGDFARETVYADDPLLVAQTWCHRGASWLHVVDLDGARHGEPMQAELIERIIQAVPGVRVQVGGGVRTLSAIERWLTAGAARVVVGTVAVERPQLIAEAIRLFGSEALVVALDSREGWVATRGWESLSPVTVDEAAAQLRDVGIRRVLVTDIDRDGALSRPNAELMARIASRGLSVLASGGVSDREDLVALARIPGVEGAIVGRALYEGRLQLTRPEDWIVAEGES